MKWISLLFMLLAFDASSQNNLVPNPSFEVYDTCPDYGGQISRAIPWFQPFTPQSSTDYFNECSNNNSADVPMNWIGFQSSKTGQGYAGFSCGYFQPQNNYREYLEVLLNDSLHNNWKYYVSFYVSFADDSRRACDKIGAYLSNSAIYYSSPLWGLLNYQPQVENDSGNIISDTANWVLVSDTMIANGGERYLTIGNFAHDSLTNWITFNAFANHLFSYYYIDDVSVVLVDSSIGVNELDENEVIISPNPFSDILSIQLLEPYQRNATIIVYSIVGKMIYSTPWKREIDLAFLESGIYILEVVTEKGSVVKKLVKE